MVEIWLQETLGRTVLYRVKKITKPCMPSLAILLSKDALDPRQPGYQPPNPHPGPSSQPTAPTSKRSLGEPAAGESSAKRSQPEPGAAEEEQTA